MTTEEERAEYDIIWDQCWRKFLTHADGSVNMEAVKRELAVSSIAYDNVSRVYCAITNNQLNRPTYSAEIVIGYYEAEVGKLIKAACAELEAANEVLRSENAALSPEQQRAGAE